METRKNWFTYIYLTIFSICISYALFSGILNIGSSQEYPFLWYGGVIIAMGTLGLVVYALALIANRLKLNRLQLQNKSISKIIESIIVISVLAVGAFLRVWVIKNIPIEPSSDYDIYYQIANLLSQGNLLTDGVGYCDYISQFPHVIGYSYILSAVFGIFGVSVPVGLYFNLVVSLVSIFLAYRIARLISGKAGGYIALVLAAFWPSQILYINHMASEPVFTCMALFSIWLAVYLFKNPFGNGRLYFCLVLYIALGVSLAMGAAIRPMSIILLIAIVICFLPSKIKLKEDKENVGVIKKGISKGWVCVLVILIGYFLCSQIISGAITRTIDRELPGTTESFGYNLLVGVNIDTKGTWNEEDSNLRNDKFLETDSAAEAHKAARDEAFKRIKENPIGIANLAFEKYALLWNNDDYGASWNLLFLEQQDNLTADRKTLLSNSIMWNNLYYLLCLFLSLVAGISLWFRKRFGPEHILILFFIGTAILHMVLESQNRYHYNILPIFSILAAYGCVELFRYYLGKTNTYNENNSISEQNIVFSTENEVTATLEQQQFSAQERSQEKNNMFDMLAAIKEGHVIVTVSEAYTKNTEDKDINMNT